MFPQFGATAESLSKASSLVLRIGTDAHLYDDPDDVSIASLLDSRFDSEKVEALKRLLALIAQGDDVSSFFPQVVKNVASQCLEVKKLVYLYLLHYAEKRPDEALLSINCFQKDLSDPNPLVRAWALRTMAGIRLHAIAPLVSVALNKCARDPSAYVRKCAANALPKLSDLHLDENNSIIEELVSLLLGDHSPVVVGAAANAFNFVCPHKLLIIGRNFRRLCEILPDVEEWGQIMLVEILLRYAIARHGLVKESVIFAPRHTQISHHRKAPFDDHTISDEGSNFPHTEELGHESSALMFGSYIGGPESYLLRTSNLGKVSERLDSNVCTTSQNDDIKLLLRCTSPLLWSHNSAVVLAAAGVHWIMAPRENLDKIVKPVLFILRSSPASKYVVLCNIQVFAKAMPSLFASYYEDFFVYSLDPYPIRTLKLEILSAIATDSSISHIFHEMQDYIRDPDRRFAADAVAAVGLCAQRIPVVANSCIEGLLALIKEESSIHDCNSTEGEAGILVQAIISIKAVIKQNPANYEKVIVQVAHTLEVIKVPPARALIVWMVGEYSSVGMTIRRVIPVIVKYLARCFTSEDLETKHQILNTVAKVALSSQGGEALMFQKILNYLLELAKYDLNYDLRDRARVMGKIVTFIINSSYKEEAIWQPPSAGELSSYILDHIFCGKMQSSPFQSNGCRAFLPGTLSQVVLHAAPGYEPLPKPCSLADGNLSTKMYTANAVNNAEGNVTYVDDSGSGDSDSLSGSSEDDSGTVDSEKSDSPNDTVDYRTLDSSHYRLDSTNNPLISISELTAINNKAANSVSEDNSLRPASDLTELMSKAALESWLDEQPNLSGSTSSATASGQQASVRIAVKEIAVSIRPTVNNLLHPITGNGLRMDYSFSQEVSNISPFLVCVDLLIENTTAEPLTNIGIKEGSEIAQSVNEAQQTHERPSSSEVPDLVPFEEIASLAPGQKINKLLQIHFHHHLLPNKLVVVCNEKKYPVKLQPDIGYFVKPLQLDIDAFAEKESRLPGMFEYNRRCTFADCVDAVDNGGDGHFNNDKILVICRKLVSKVLSGANVFFVSVDMPISVKFDDASGLCLRFSGEILSSSKPCLLTVTAEGSCSELLGLSVKVNCEDTIFGLNLLNRVVSLLS